MCLTSPPLKAPDSALPPAMGRCRWLSLWMTVKLARGRSHGLRVATDGEPKYVSENAGVDKSGHTVVLSCGLVRRDSQDEVSTVVALLPHHLFVATNHAARVVTGLGLNGTLLAAGADSSSGEFDTNATGTGLGVVVLGSEPGEIRDLYFIRFIQIKYVSGDLPSSGGYLRQGKCCCQCCYRTCASACGYGWRCSPKSSVPYLNAVSFNLHPSYRR